MFRPLFSLLLLGLFASNAFAQTASVERGEVTFAAECSRCHVPVEMDARLRARWTGRPAQELFAQIQSTMPAETPGSLSAEDYLDLTAFILQSGNVHIEGGEISANALATLTIEPGATTSITADETSAPWTHWGGTEKALRYSPLDQIDASNVNDLEIAWTFDTASFGPSSENFSVATPLMVNGRIYTTAGATRNVVSLDAASGQLLWMWRPEEGERFTAAPRKGSGKGLSYYNNGGQEVIFTITPGYTLVALNARTGLPMENFGNRGSIDLQQGLRLGPGREDLDIGISFPPLVVEDVVIAGAAHLVGMRPISASNVKGDIRGFDANSGELLWTFKTIPERGEIGFETWLNGSTDYTGNAGVWSMMSADAERGTVYLPVESATGDRYGGDRHGNNLFSSSTVALDFRTGERKWHFQTTHHDIWDWDTPSAPLIIDLPDGRPAVVQTLKQSHLFMFDPDSGEPLFPVEERPVPASDIPGELAAATQPFPLKPAPYDRQGFQEDDLVDFTPQILAMAKEAAAPYRFSELYTPPSRYMDPNDGTLGTLHLPSSTGGSNWEGAAYDPETGHLFISSRTYASQLTMVNDPDASSVAWIQGGGRTPTVDGLPLVKPPYGRITAIDLSSGDHLWMMANADTPAEIAEHPLLEGVDIPRTGKPTRSVLVLTKTLLFAGEGAGGPPVLRAHDKTTGEIVAEIETPAPVTGVPITYMHKGKQYLAMTVSDLRNPAKLITLALP